MRVISSLISLALAVSTTALASTSTAAVVAQPDATTRMLEQLLAPPASSPVRIHVQRVAGLPANCTPVTAVPLSPLDRSGPAVVDVSDAGGTCNARVVVDIRLEQPVLVVKAATVVGAPLAAVTAMEMREVVPHAVTTLPDGAIARRALVPGRVLVDDDLALPGPAVGEPVKIVLQKGGLRLVRSAVAMPCAGAIDRRQHCARLPNGRQVHGVFHAGVIELQETP
jgi:flagella basal body P-ring formation protein FlgA